MSDVDDIIKELNDIKIKYGSKAKFDNVAFYAPYIPDMIFNYRPRHNYE